MGIATHGYTFTAHPGLRPHAALAFFPLYPLLVHFGIALGLNGIWVAMAISNIAFAGALLYVYRLATLRFGHQVGRRAVWLLAFFPTAFFTFAPYTESLFLLGAAAGYYSARQGHAWRCGFWLTIALATRSTGLILFLPAISMLGAKHWRTWVAVLVPAGATIVLYGLYLHAHQVTLLNVMQAQRVWHRALTFPWTGFTASVAWIYHHPTLDPGLVVEDSIGVLATLFCLLITVKLLPDMDLPAALYCIGFWLMILTAPQWLDNYAAPFGSTVRFVLVLIPLFILWAHRISDRVCRIWVGAAGTAMMCAAAVHLYGGWIA